MIVNKVGSHNSRFLSKILFPHSVKELPLLGGSELMVTPVHKPGIHNHVEGIWKNELKPQLGDEGVGLFVLLVTPFPDNQMLFNWDSIILCVKTWSFILYVINFLLDSFIP